MLEINLPLCLIIFFFTKAVCCEEINVGKTFFNFFELALEKTFCVKNRSNRAKETCLGLDLLVWHLQASRL